MASRLNKTVTANVKRVIKARGNPSLYWIGHEMAKIMVRPPGIGLDWHGPEVKPETCRKAVEMCLAGRKLWRLDYLEAVASVFEMDIRDIVSASRPSKPLKP